MLPTKAWAARTAQTPLAPFEIQRRDPGPRDVVIDILYCGVCHTDIHMSRGHVPGLVFPMVPGHEIVGRVASVGKKVTRHRAGDTVGVGCMVGSCRECAQCHEGEEHFCASMVATYGGYDVDGRTPAFGGYSNRITVDEHFVLKISPDLDPAGAAPLLCAGITTYSPLRYWGVGKGSHVGVIGLGGLGHMAVKLAVAMGAHVTVFSTSERKRADALRLGASEFVVSTQKGALGALANRFNVVLNTVAGSVDTDAYCGTLHRDGAFVLLGLPDAPVVLTGINFLYKRMSFTGSLIGGIPETQEMLDFCAEHGIVSDYELISIDQVDGAYERVLKSDVRYRFVIDLATLG